MARTFANPQHERLERERLERCHAAIAAEAIVLRQEHGRERWWDGHGPSASCLACRLASFRLGYPV